MNIRSRSVELRLRPVTRSADGAMKIRGTAIVYDAPSPSGHLPFREVIKPGAFRDTLADPNTDLLLLVGHDRNRPLARQSAGNLTVRDTPAGLEFEAELVDTSDGRDAYELLRRQIVKGCSFAFMPDEDGERWYTRDGETWCEVSRVHSLFELTLTADPVYTQTDASARSAALAAIRRSRAGRKSDPYSAETGHSWFRDAWLLSEARSGTEKMVRDGHIRMPLHTDAIELAAPNLTNRDQGGLDAARARLAQVPYVERDVGTGAFAGLTPVGVPDEIAYTFATKTRAEGAIPGALTVVPLPAKGMNVQGLRLTSGASVEVQTTENIGPTEVDPASSSISSPVSMIVGYFDISRQALDRCEAGLDEGIANELGAALAAKLDETLLTGAGTGLTLRGLLNVASITDVAYTDASPTQAEAWPKLLEAWSTASTALGKELDRVVMHGRRRAWFGNWKDSAGALVRPDWPGQLRQANAIATNGGAGTNEDYVLLMRADELPVYLGQPRIAFQDGGPGAPQTVRIVARMYASALFARRPEAIARVSGTGFVPPSFA